MLDRLAEDFSAGRFAHAYLFLGPEGVGKSSVARLCAMAAVCRHGGGAQAEGMLSGLLQEAPQEAPCGTCGPCVRVHSGSHPDVQIHHIGKSLGVEEMRGIIESVQVRAYEGGAKVVILCGAEGMTVQAQNCLLKTLEEPPEDTCFILTAKIQSALLPTILSRCRLIRFHPLEEEAAKRRLTALGVESIRAAYLAHLSEGSVGRALDMARDEGYFALLERVSKALFATKRMGDVCAVAQSFKDDKDKAERILDMTQGLLRDAMRAQLAGGHRNDWGYSQEFDAYTGKAPVSVTLRLLDEVSHARQMRGSNVTFANVWEQLLLKIAEEQKAWQW